VSKVRKLLVEVTVLALLFCCYFAQFLNTWAGLFSNGVGLLSNGVGLFSGERVLEIQPPSLSSHLSSRCVDRYNW